MFLIKDFNISLRLKRGRANWYLSTHISAKVLGIPLKVARVDRVTNLLKF